MNKQVEEKPNNKAFWIFMSVGAFIVVLAVVVGIIFAGNSNKNNDPEATDGPQTGENFGLAEKPPVIEKVDSTLSDSTITFNITTSEKNLNEWFVEYELADQNRKVVSTGYERKNVFTVTTKITDSAFYRIKVRLSDKEKTTAWSESYTIKLNDVKGVKTLEPTPAYYTTPWATGEGGKDNLQNALQVAYNAVGITETDISYCLPLNTGVMRPTLLLPPVPAVSPTGVVLGFRINEFNSETNEGSVTYYWC